MPPLVTSLTRLVLKEEQGRYLREAIRIHAGMETLSISYSYTRHRILPSEGGRTIRSEVNIIDIALEDRDHCLVGASGSERQDILIHENYASPGYRGMPLEEGDWYIILGACMVEDPGCEVVITVTQTPREPLLLRGETHCHTLHSDGWYTAEELIARARQDRLDYLFITDHNNMTLGPFLRSQPEMTVIPAVEVTYYNGHYNLYGVARPIRTFVANSRDEVLSIMQEGRSAGALASINHPVSPGVSWNFGIGEEVPADLIEIWNGPFTPYNQASIDLWHKALSQGRVWPAIGGSDYHHAELFRSYGTPCTFLYTLGRGTTAILEAMRKGHAFIGMNIGAPVLYLQLGDARMGDLHAGDEKRLAFRVEGLGGQDEIRLLNQEGVFYRLSPGASYRFEGETDIKDSLFVRMEVWRSLLGFGETLAAISNPIYLQPSSGEAL